MCLSAGPDRCGKSRLPPPGFDPRTVQPAASRKYDKTLMNLILLKSRYTKFRRSSLCEYPAQLVSQMLVLHELVARAIHS